MALTEIQGSALASSAQKLIGNRNIIINGAMEVAQRGTTSTTTNDFVCDRFKVSFSGEDEDPTYAQVALTSSDTGPWAAGFRNALQVTNGNQTGGAGGGDYCRISYIVEAQDIAKSGWDYTSASSYATLSYWVKSSVGQVFNAFLRSADGTMQQYPFTTNTLSADTWTKISRTIPGNTNIQFDNNTGNGLEIYIHMFEGTDATTSASINDAWAAYNASAKMRDFASGWWTTNDATFAITGVQLEVGNSSTEFEHRSYSDELLRCMRYYEGVYMTDGTAAFKGYAASGSSANFEYQFKVDKRAKPTFSLEGNAAWSGATPSPYESISECMFQVNAGTLFSLGDADGDLCCSFDAEL